MEAKVSVIVASYNYGEYITGALDSAVAQEAVVKEIIVIDDGSTDDTYYAVEPFLRLPFVRYYRVQRSGQPRAKNAGILLARYPLIAFLDADDRWQPGKLRAQAALLARQPTVGVVFSGRRLIDRAGKVIRVSRNVLRRGLVLEKIFRTNFVCFSSTLIRKRVFEEVGLFNETISLAIDYDLWLRVAPHWRFDFADRPLVDYRTGHFPVAGKVQKRIGAITQIIGAFLSRRANRSLLRRKHVRTNWKETYCHAALAFRETSKLAGLAWFGRALGQDPLYLLAWKGILGSLIPRRLWAGFRSARLAPAKAVGRL